MRPRGQRRWIGLAAATGVTLLALPCAAQPRCAGADPAIGDPVVGMVRRMTPELGQRACPEPVSTQAELADEVWVEPELPAHLRPSFELRRPGPSLSGQTATQWVAQRVFGGSEPREGRLADELSNALSVGVLSCQLLTDVSLQARYGLPSDFTWRVIMMDSVAHGVAQGLSWIGRRLGEADDASCPGEEGCEPQGIRPSGRATLGFTSAALMCLHQQMVGGDDWGHCAGGLALAATIGAVRALGPEHRFSDVALSAGVGLFSGYLLPLVTFYGFGGSAPARSVERATDGVHAWLSPIVSTRGLGVRAEGTF